MVNQSVPIETQLQTVQNETEISKPDLETKRSKKRDPDIIINCKFIVSLGVLQNIILTNVSQLT